MKKNLFLASALAAAAFFLNACGSGSGSGESDPGADTRGPADTFAFSGAEVTFNPILRFLGGGVLHYFNEPDSSHFAAGFNYPKTTPGNPAIGTYTYEAGTDYQTGTLTIILPDIGFADVVPVTRFTTVGGFVQSFTLGFTGEQPARANVTSGTILAGQPASGGGGGGGGGDDGFVFKEDGNIEGPTVITKSHVSTVYGGTWGGTTLSDCTLPIRTPGEIGIFTIASNGNFEMAGLRFRYFTFTSPYTISLPYIGSNNNVLTYRGPDAASGGVYTVNFSLEDPQLLSIYWESNIYSDNERQNFE